MDVLVCGHTHIPFVKRIGKVLVVNCGSVGQPVDGDPRGTYALATLEKGAAPAVRIVRFAYSQETVLEAYRNTGLPKRLARDLREGLKKRETP